MNKVKYACKGHVFEKSRGRYSIRPIHNKSLFDSENFSSFAKFAFSEQTTFTQKTKRSKIFARKELAPFCLQGYYLKKG